MSGGAPLRFLALVVGGWVCARAAIVASDAPEPPPLAPAGAVPAAIVEAHRPPIKPIPTFL